MPPISDSNIPPINNDTTLLVQLKHSDIKIKLSKECISKITKDVKLTKNQFNLNIFMALLLNPLMQYRYLQYQLQATHNNN